MMSNSSNPDNRGDNRWVQPLDRNFFEYLLELEVRKATRYLYYFSLLVVQLDGLKSRAADAAEESVHRTLGFLMRDEIRGTDLLGKRVDSSFFIVLHYTDLENAIKVGQRIRERVEHYTFDSGTEKDRRTISIGVSCFPTTANDVAGLIQKSEQLLMNAQERGGNLVSMPD
ncbi:MAG TPA: diguanylate cyclase [Nitrospiria bacterium]|nr:diguanylate cyclase [Nitrospiria bacterium]HUK56121.1 diguanylate cyclase [Nitrospiria bacterium]